MRLTTLFLYLIGNRQAMFDIAADRNALKIGFLFVLSAGFAREYDGEDLLHEPWYVLIPLAASIVSSFVLYFATYGVDCMDRPRGPRPSFFDGYRSFLGLFWMTAPLAWLYAIPYERFLSPLDAMQANLITLAVVATWRVFLMVRVVSVLMGYGGGAIFVVMAFADALLLGAIALVPYPLIDIMGGIRLIPEERLIRDTANYVCFAGIVSIPVWSIGALVAWSKVAQNKVEWPVSDGSPRRLDRKVAALAIASVAIWAMILPFTQPEQILRRRVERMMTEDDIAGGLRLMSAHERGDFPPHWDPPPFERYGRDRPELSAVLAAMEREPPAEWVQAIYSAKDKSEWRKKHSMFRPVGNTLGGPHSE